MMVNEETDILCYRLRTARQRKRMARKGFEKKLISLHREERKLCRQTRELGWVELDPPVMRGWKRYFVLRHDTAKSKQADFFQGILDRINKTEYSSRKDFKQKKRERGKKIYIVREQELDHPYEWQLQKLNFTQNEMEYFEERLYWSKSSKIFYKIYVFKEPWRFVLQTRPNLITRTRIRDEVLENRLEEIDDYLERNFLRARQSKLTDGYYYGHHRYRYLFPQGAERRTFRSLPLNKILDEIKEH